MDLFKELIGATAGVIISRAMGIKSIPGQIMSGLAGAAFANAFITKENIQAGKEVIKKITDAMTDFFVYIKKAEGGLSRAITDTASKNPAPWEWKDPKDGKVKTGWHTNKGVTYETFIGSAPKLGYAITPENFFLMPEEIWSKIFKIQYWDKMKGDLYTSKVIAAAIADYAWAFGVGGATSNPNNPQRPRLVQWLKSKYNVIADGPITLANAINSLVKKHGEKQIFIDLMAHRRQAFIALNQTDNEKGWLARMDKLEAFGLKHINS